MLLNGTVMAGQECTGSVLMNGAPLQCGGDFQVVGGDTLERLGNACQNFMNSPDAILQVVFPCGTFDPVMPD